MKLNKRNDKTTSTGPRVGSGFTMDRRSFLQRSGLAVGGLGAVAIDGATPSAHLSLDHGRRGSQHLGLRGDDQLLQRHPQLQGHPGHRRQPSRGPSGRNATPCPVTTKFSTGAWKYGSRVWGLDYDWIAGRFDDGSYKASKGKALKPMNTKDIPASRWIDGVLEEGLAPDQKARSHGH
jgi:hypothetical protein